LLIFVFRFKILASAIQLSVFYKPSVLAENIAIVAASVEDILAGAVEEMGA